MNKPLLGAHYVGNGKSEFLLWAPFVSHVDVKRVTPDVRVWPMEKQEKGYFHSIIDANPGDGYVYVLDHQVERADPASRFQPAGVHQYSLICESNYVWKNCGWKGINLRDYVIYELHVGTFSREGTFRGICEHLPYLKELGITAIELMPIAQFPGERNWGYDGVYPYAVHSTYGSPDDLRAMVDEVHSLEMAVIVDVVYNHLGPEGNYLRDFGPYFTRQYKTPWGEAINFDDAGSDEVRRYFIENALFWIKDFQIDALRLDATHAMLDQSPVHFLEEIADSIHRETEGRKVYVIAENAQNDAKFFRSKKEHGYGMDAVWSDDLSHALHVLLTKEQYGFYADYGKQSDLAKSLETGFTYTGQYSKFRGRRHGSDPTSIPSQQFVVCSQNHDLIGNRMFGERLGHLTDFEGEKLSAAVTLLSPYIPLIFMGQEYGEDAPFQYFIDHSDRALIHAVREGRRTELCSCAGEIDLPDPQDAHVFQNSKLNHALKGQGRHKVLLDYFRSLALWSSTLRQEGCFEKGRYEVANLSESNLISIRYRLQKGQILCVFYFGSAEKCVKLSYGDRPWETVLDSSDAQWGGKSRERGHVLDEADILLSLHPRQFVMLKLKDSFHG